MLSYIIQGAVVTATVVLFGVLALQLGKLVNRLKVVASNLDFLGCAKLLAREEVYSCMAKRSLFENGI